jgi:hypothetical protein
MQHSGMSSVERDQQAHLCLGISEKRRRTQPGNKSKGEISVLSPSYAGFSDVMIWVFKSTGM